MNSTVESRIEDLKNLKQNLNENIKAFEKQIVTLKSRITEIEEEIQTLESQ